MTTHVSADWIEEKLRELRQDADEIWNVAPDVSNPFNSWSAIKLMSLAATVDFYTNIISGNFDNFYFIDALSGSGCVTLNDGEEHLVGSPILTAAIAHTPFTNMYFTECDADKTRALRQRLDFVSDNLSYGLEKDQYEVRTGDANQLVPTVIEEIKEDSVYNKERAHILAFVDNEGLDIDFSTMESLTEVWSDLLINFPSVAVRRQAGAGHEKSMNTFFGDNRWKAANADANELRAIYKGNISQLGRPIQRHIPVRSGDGFFYDMIYATRETPKGSPYVNAFEYMEEQLEDISGEEINKVLQLMRGEKSRLNLFPDDENEQTSMEEYL